MCLAVLLLSILGTAYSLCPGGDATDDGEAIAALRAQAEKQIDAREWKKAKATARQLKKVLPREERPEVERLLHRIAGHEQYSKLHTDWGRSPKPHETLRKLEKFLKTYGSDDELEALGIVLREVIRVTIYVTVDDFEDGVDEDDWRWVKDGKLVKHGSYAARWRSQSIEDDGAYLFCDEKNWSRFTHLVLWIHNEDAKKGGTITLDAMGVGDDDYFQQVLVVNWKGWRELRLPLQGKKSRFQRHGQARWEKIDGLRFWKEEGRRVDIVVDDVRLELPVNRKARKK